MAGNNTRVIKIPPRSPRANALDVCVGGGSPKVERPMWPAPVERARVTMPPVAEILGLDPRPVAFTPRVIGPVAEILGLDPRLLAFTPRVTGPVAEIDDDGVYIKDADVTLLACRSVTAEWAALARSDRRVVLARSDRRVVLVVGYAPMPEDMPVDTYIQQIGQSGRLVVGFVPLHDATDR
jgi:hypothetical protein